MITKTKRIAVLSAFTLAVLFGAVAPADAAITQRFRIAGCSTNAHPVALPGGVTYRIELDGRGRTDLDLVVLDGFGRRIAAGTGPSDHEVVYVTVTHGGWFRILVENLDGSSSSYRLTVTP